MWLCLSFHNGDSGVGQSPPNMEIVAVHCRAGFSPISVTQKTKLVFWLPQTEYRETLAERDVDIVNTNKLLILDFCNCCILAQNRVRIHPFQDDEAKLKNSTINKLFFRPHRLFLFSKMRSENGCGSLQTYILDKLKILSHTCPNAVMAPISMPHCILEALLQRRSSFSSHHRSPWSL